MAGAAAALTLGALALGASLLPVPSAPSTPPRPAPAQPAAVLAVPPAPSPATAPPPAPAALRTGPVIAPPHPRPFRPSLRPAPRPRLQLAALSSRSIDAGPGPRPRPAAPEREPAALSAAERARMAPLLAEAAALVEAPPSTLRNASPLACLAVSIYHEARDQPLLGQQAIAAVILRRVETARWGDTICAVVRPVQFSYLAPDYSFAPIEERGAWRRALTVAIRAMVEGPPPVVSEADHYHAAYVSPSWRRKMREVVRIGGHVFYRDPLSEPHHRSAAAQTPADPLRLAGRAAARAAD